MTTVGLSGGIGSGKTFISRIFLSLGIPVFYADTVVKSLYEEHSGLQSSLRVLLGNDIYKDGKLQRKIMASLIFQDQELLIKVNALVHPLVAEEFQKWSNEQHTPYVIQEAAILFESQVAEVMNFNIAVTAPESLRIMRVMKRDHVTEAEIKQRMLRQWPDEQRNAMADFIMINDDKHALLPQVIAIHENILSKT
jgi:dephospho-CoA kinase